MWYIVPFWLATAGIQHLPLQYSWPSPRNRCFSSAHTRRWIYAGLTLGHIKPTPARRTRGGFILCSHSCWLLLLPMVSCRTASDGWSGLTEIKEQLFWPNTRPWFNAGLTSALNQGRFSVKNSLRYLRVTEYIRGFPANIRRWPNVSCLLGYMARSSLV